jgi:peptidoglycan/LPS O-acetylase OafA/YrhL
MTEKSRYTTLDCLRGVAAIAVVFFHIGNYVKGAPVMVPHGFLAVDFFFMLSGFVIALSYQKKFEFGFSIAEFIKRRVIRLYPVAMIGACLGGMKLILIWSVGYSSVESISVILEASILNIFMLPYISRTSFAGTLFPVNGVLWSLFLEIFINIVWGLLSVSTTNKVLYFICLIAGAIGICYIVPQQGSADVGWTIQSLSGGLARVAFSFMLGVIFFNWGFRIKAPQLFCNPLSLSIVLLAIVCLPGGGWQWDLFSIFFLLPLVLALGIASGSERSAPLSEFLGDLSYPLYALHLPMVTLIGGLHDKLFSRFHQPLFFGLIGLALSVFTAIIVLKYFDIPVRRFLTNSTHYWKFKSATE